MARACRRQSGDVVGQFRPVEHSASFEPDERLLPATVLIGDSFLDGMVRSGLQANFVESRRIRWRPDRRVSEIVSSLPPDTRWVVMQFIEVSTTAIHALANEDDIVKAATILDARQQAPQNAQR